MEKKRLCGRQYSRAAEHLNEKGQSILDVAVKHQKIPLARLHRVVDKKGNTLLQIWSIAEEEPSLGVHLNFRRSCNGLRLDLFIPLSLPPDKNYSWTWYSIFRLVYKSTKPIKTFVSIKLPNPVKVTEKPSNGKKFDFNANET
jgi:hypothetical protein